MARYSRRNIWINRADNSNTIAVQRQQTAQRTARSIAASRSNARNTALQNVHHEIAELTKLPPHGAEYTVERLIPVRFQPLAQTRVPDAFRRRILGRQLLRAEDKPMTVFEYAHGRPEKHGSNPQRLRVVEILRGWLLPDIIEKPNVPSKTLLTPSQNEPRAMIVVSDHRSWAGGVRPHYPGPADQDPRNTIGVVDNNYARWGSRAIEGISEILPNATEASLQQSTEKLHEIADALAQIRHNATSPQPPNQQSLPI